MLLLFGLFVALGEFLTQDSAHSMAAERLSVARLTAKFLDRQFDQQFSQLEWAAAQVNMDAPLSSGDPQHLTDLTHKSGSFVSSVFLVDEAGHVVWSDPPDAPGLGDDLSQMSFVQQPLASGQRYASPVFADPITGAPTAVFAVPVFGSDGPCGVLAATVDGSDGTFRVLMSAAGEVGAGGHAELVDQNLRLIASNERGHALGPAEHPSFYARLLERHEAGVGLTDPIGDEDPADSGQRHIMAFVPLKEVPWGIGLGGSEAAFTALSERWRTYTLPLGGVALVIAVFLVWITRRSVIAPLKTLTNVSQRMAAGDLTTPIPPSGDGEVLHLEKAFDSMRHRLHEAQASETELSRLKDEFLAIAAHELRTPVAALMAMTQLQRSRLTRGQPISDREALGQVHEQVERLGRLVAQLLDSSRIETGKLSLERQPSDLKCLVEEVAEAVRVADSSDHTLEIHAPASLPAVVDPLRISQVVRNLLENALKYSPPGAPVRVDLTQPEPATARICVRDHGTGIPAAHRARVFERYFQEPYANGSGGGSGLGLGLYVSREIVELHSGKICVESPPDGGTSFVVTLPTGVD
jgi:signal transduction histidine kinase